jgi:hypothetical protein
MSQHGPTDRDPEPDSPGNRHIPPKLTMQLHGTPAARHRRDGPARPVEVVAATAYREMGELLHGPPPFLHRRQPPPTSAASQRRSSPATASRQAPAERTASSETFHVDGARSYADQESPTLLRVQEEWRGTGDLPSGSGSRPGHRATRSAPGTGGGAPAGRDRAGGTRRAHRGSSRSPRRRAGLSHPPGPRSPGGRRQPRSPRPPHPRARTPAARARRRCGRQPWGAVRCVMFPSSLPSQPAVRPAVLVHDGLRERMYRPPGYRLRQTGGPACPVPMGSGGEPSHPSHEPLQPLQAAPRTSQARPDGGWEPDLRARTRPGGSRRRWRAMSRCPPDLMQEDMLPRRIWSSMRSRDKPRLRPC